MLGICVNNNSQVCYFLKSKSNLFRLSLSSLVMAAGAATIGVAIAGYIPQWAIYLGSGVIAVDFMVTSVWLLRHYFAARQEGREVNPVPDEILVHIFQHLDLPSLKRAQLVSRQWNGVAKDNMVVKTAKEAHPWKEKAPNLESAVTYSYRVGRVKKPKPIMRPKDKAIDYAFSGNHFMFVHEGGEYVEIWQVGSKNKEEQFTLRKKEKFSGPKVHSIGCYGEIAYLGLEDGKIILWDLATDKRETWDTTHKGAIDHITVTKDQIVTRAGRSYKIWNRRDRKWIYSISSSSKVFALTNTHFCTNFGEHNLRCKARRPAIWKGSDVTAMIAYDDKVICGYKTGEIRIWNLTTWKSEKISGHNTSVLRMRLSGDVLVTQSKFGTIRLYDLKRKKRLHKINPGKDFYLKGVTAGMIMTSTASRFKIWDYR